jgi:hypothetical protein
MIPFVKIIDRFITVYRFMIITYYFKFYFSQIFHYQFILISQAGFKILSNL